MPRYSYQDPRMMRERDPVLTRLFMQRGAITTVASELGISRQAVSRWKHCPPEHVPVVARMFGIPQYELIRKR